MLITLILVILSVLIIALSLVVFSIAKGQRRLTKQIIFITEDLIDIEQLLRELRLKIERRENEDVRIIQPGDPEYYEEWGDEDEEE